MRWPRRAPERKPHDIDAVTDRYLRRFGDPIDRGMGFVWPHDSFRWASTRADLAVARTGHAMRNAGLGLTRLGRAMDRSAEALRAFAASIGDRFDGK